MRRHPRTARFMRTDSRCLLDVLQGAVPSMEEGRQQNAGYLNASAAAERLQRNVNREHFLCTDFLLAFWQVCAALCAKRQLPSP